MFKTTQKLAHISFARLHWLTNHYAWKATTSTSLWKSTSLVKQMDWPAKWKKRKKLVMDQEAVYGCPVWVVP